jgi:hypothetical protein
MARNFIEEQRRAENRPPLTLSEDAGRLVDTRDLMFPPELLPPLVNPFPSEYASRLVETREFIFPRPPRAEALFDMSGRQEPDGTPRYNPDGTRRYDPERAARSRALNQRRVAATTGRALREHFIPRVAEHSLPSNWAERMHQAEQDRLSAPTQPSDQQASNMPSLRSQPEFYMTAVTPVDTTTETLPDDAECTICLEPLVEDVVKFHACGHMFHTMCVLSWFDQSAPREGKKRGTCPNCRHEFCESDPRYYARSGPATGRDILATAPLEALAHAATLGRFEESVTAQVPAANRPPRSHTPPHIHEGIARAAPPSDMWTGFMATRTPLPAHNRSRTGRPDISRYTVSSIARTEPPAHPDPSAPNFPQERDRTGRPNDQGRWANQSPRDPFPELFYAYDHGHDSDSESGIDLIIKRPQSRALVQAGSATACTSATRAAIAAMMNPENDSEVASLVERMRQAEAANTEPLAPAPAPPAPERESRAVLAARAIAERRPLEEDPNLNRPTKALPPTSLQSDRRPGRPDSAQVEAPDHEEELGEIARIEEDIADRRQQQWLENRGMETRRSTRSLEAERSALSQRLAEVTRQLNERPAADLVETANERQVTALAPPQGRMDSHEDYPPLGSTARVSPASQQPSPPPLPAVLDSSATIGQAGRTNEELQSFFQGLVDRGRNVSPLADATTASGRPEVSLLVGPPSGGETAESVRPVSHETFSAMVDRIIAEHNSQEDSSGEEDSDDYFSWT